ncbi:hypothetical protein D918_07484 [Trichuris suis]|nr:hypothetical protein D918_07484 [Trichuris suis]
MFAIIFLFRILYAPTAAVDPASFLDRYALAAAAAASNPAAVAAAATNVAYAQTAAAAAAAAAARNSLSAGTPTSLQTPSVPSLGDPYLSAALTPITGYIFLLFNATSDHLRQR